MREALPVPSANFLNQVEIVPKWQKCPISQKALDNLGRLAAATLCSIAAIGVFSPESAARPDSIREGGEAIPAQQQECGDPPEQAPAAEQLDTMRCLILRANPQPKMTFGTSLASSARRKTRDVIRHGFSHTAGDKPFSFYISDKFEGWRAENLAQGGGSKGAAQSIFSGWMHSPGHRKHILDKKWNRFGVAMEREGDTNYWTAHFGDFKATK